MDLQAFVHLAGVDLAAATSVPSVERDKVQYVRVYLEERGDVHPLPTTFGHIDDRLFLLDPHREVLHEEPKETDRTYDTLSTKPTRSPKKHSPLPAPS